MSDPLWREAAQRVASVADPGGDKRMDLAQAVERFVRPGMTLNPVSLQSRPVAALHALMRRFAGRDPGFTFVSSSLSGNYLQLVGSGMLSRAIVSFAGEGYPTPGPSPVVARALAAGEVALENWTMLTVSQALLAGAMGVPFLPTRSLSGSQMAEELREAGRFAEIDDPFHAGEPGEPVRRQGVVRAIVPDLSFVHAWAADPAGNAVCFPPYQENVYGALSAREGVVLTVHRVVSSAFVRAHSHLVRIPADRVVAVCEAPYGSHPYGNYAAGSDGLVPYANDYAFMRAHRDAQEQADRYDAWLREWILDLPDHAAYLEKLGGDRLRDLERAADPGGWRGDLEASAHSLSAAGAPGPVEEMIVQAARLVCDRVAAAGHTAVLSGVGQAALAAWLASHLARSRGLDFTNLAETGMVGHDPRPADPFLVNYRNMPTTTQLTDVFEALGLHACGAANRCMATLGAGQVDRAGNLNSSWTKQGRFLVGSGGANDLGSAAAELLVVAAQREQTFVPEVDFVTTPGDRVRHVVSTHGIFERRDGALVLTGVFEGAGATPGDAVERIRERCGFALDVADDLVTHPAARPDEVALLRIFDPERAFLGRTGRA
jgi:acyl CoA:acetate/3-ketoacid CoA transferase alpha subunit/acyl CoA:acetate/3-ketoacid CoA transferase beta subunit